MRGERRIKKGLMERRRLLKRRKVNEEEEG